MRILTADSDSLLVYFQHYSGRFPWTLEEDSLKDCDDEIHRRVIVIVHENSKRGGQVYLGRKIRIDLSEMIVVHASVLSENNRQRNVRSTLRMRL